MSSWQETNEGKRRRNRRRTGRPQAGNGEQPETPAYEYKSRTAVSPADLRMALAEGSYIVFDIETTGGNPERNGITEIFALRYEGGEVKDTFYSMVNPRVPIPGIVRRMTGITNKMVRDAPPIKAVMPHFIEFIGNHILVSHNTIGDLKFLVYFARKACAHDLQNFFLCTHLLTEKLIPESSDKSLQGLGKFLGIAQGPVHRAKEDSYLTLELFKVLLTKLQAQNIERIEDAVRLQGDMDSGLRLGWALHHNLAEDLPGTPGVLKLYDRQDRELFISSSFHLKRSFSALQRYHTQPRQLQRVVLQSYRLEWEEHAHIFAAMLSEASLCAKVNLRYHPEQWHLRFVPALCLKKEGNSVRLVIASVTAGVTHAYGPIYDKKAAQGLVEAIAAVFGTNVSRKGVVLPAEKAQWVVDFFEQKLPEGRGGLASKLLNMKYLFNSGYRQEMKRQDEELRRLKGLSVNPALGSLLQEYGVIVAPHHEGPACDLYPITAGRPGAAQLISDGRWQDWLQGSAGQEFIAKLEREQQGGHEAAVGRQEATLVNAALWIIYAGRGKKQHSCSYFSLADLKTPAIYQRRAPVAEEQDEAEGRGE